MSLSRVLKLAAVCIAIAFPGVVGAGYVANIGVVALLFVMLGASFNLMFGMTGYLALTHAAWFGMGAYLAGLMTTSLGWGFVVNLVASIAIVSCLAFALGSYLFRRVRGFPFAIVTLGVTVSLWVVASHWMDVTRGPLGIPGVGRPSIAGVSLSGAVPYFYLGVVLAAVTVGVCWTITRTDVGRVLLAIRDNERMVATLGIDTFNYKVAVYTLSGGLAAAAGVYYAHYLTVVSPDVFWLYWITMPLVIVHVAGLGHLPAVVLVAVLLAVIPELLRAAQAYQQLFFGIALVAAVTLVPGGLGGWWTRRRRSR